MDFARRGPSDATGASQVAEMLVRRIARIVLTGAAFLAASVHADEGGVSFWLPGQQSSFAAVQGAPGWSVPVVYYHTSSDAGASKQFVVGGNLVAGLDAKADLVFVAPTYTFAQPVLGGQGSFTLTVAGGRMQVGVDATLTGPNGGSISASRSDSLTGFADLYPTGTVKWSNGVHRNACTTHRPDETDRGLRAGQRLRECVGRRDKE